MGVNGNEKRTLTFTFIEEKVSFIETEEDRKVSSEERRQNNNLQISILKKSKVERRAKDGQVISMEREMEKGNFERPNHCASQKGSQPERKKDGKERKQRNYGSDSGKKVKKVK